ncbi:PREDICTED: rho GTPase-activating protein 18 [Propithecus coquereli]|uniref:rho GTPase-activating protein 18 n=1 Tax=Propithecus coquereli TaxID=379532 RepID=UPI00063F6DBF|nr:PREDICTED: rho GTPase-activating protein 18 [Propithecus coquereli]
MSWLSSSQGVVLTAYHPSGKDQAVGGSHAKAGEEATSRKKSDREVGSREKGITSVRRTEPKLMQQQKFWQLVVGGLSLSGLREQERNRSFSTCAEAEPRGSKVAGLATAHTVSAVCGATAPEGELEEEWLKEAGLSNLFGESAGDPQESMVFLSTLTRTQAAAVQKRVETVSQTLRKKNKQYQIPDVRDIFAQQRESKDKASNLIVGEEKLMLPEDAPASETDINLEVSFAEQAVSQKENSKEKTQKSTDNDALSPNFRLPKDKTGTTRIGDLAPQDMKKVCHLALIELTALYDVLGVELKQQKAVKIKMKDSGLFGVPLTVLLEQDQRKVPGTRIPLIFQKCSDLFNLSADLPTKKQQLQALNLLVILLPDANRDTLKALLEFLQRVIDNKEKNKMTVKNIAMVMAPNLFMCHALGLKSSEQREFVMAAGTANIMHLLIKYQKLLWTIPKFIVNQVRKQNTENHKKDKKAMKKLLKKMAYDREKYEKQDKNTNDADVPQGVIRVQAPHLSKVSMAIQLTEELKASDVLARFLSQESGVAQTLKKGEVFLYEIGGNIGERCLDDDTYMKDLYQLNPNAEWVIKSKPS